MINNNNKWIVPSTLKTVLDENTKLEEKIKEEVENKKKQSWDDLSQEEQVFFIANKNICCFCGNKLSQSKYQRKINFEKSTSRRDGPKRISRTITRCIYVNECAECHKIHIDEDKCSKDIMPFILFPIIIFIFIICYSLFNDYTIGFLILLGLGCLFMFYLRQLLRL